MKVIIVECDTCDAMWIQTVDKLDAFIPLEFRCSRCFTKANVGITDISALSEAEYNILCNS